jgi:hypothetical protein
MARKELLVVAAMAMGAGLVFADGAVSRGSGGSSSGSSSGGSSVGGGGSASSSSSSSSSSSGGGSSWSGSTSGSGRRTPSTPAQARAPRPSGHSGHSGGASGGNGGYYPGYPGYSGYPGYGSGCYYPNCGYGLYGGPWYAGFGWGYPSWGYSGWGYWGYYDPFFSGYYAGGRSGGGGGRSRRTEPATVRLVSDPEDARVIVDGKETGTVSDYDDMSERLRLTSGSHEIVIEKAGYVTHRIHLYVQAGEDVKIRHFLDKGAGETSEVVGAPPPKLNLKTEVEAPQVELETSRERQDAEFDSEPAEPATLTVRVDPEDATVYVDGRFVGTSEDVDEMEVSAGTHTIEVVRPGYRSVELQVALEKGKDKSVEVRLEKP